MFQALMAQPKDTAWLVATGSLTNVGSLLRKHPEVVGHLKGISIMGGSVGDGFSDAPPSRVNGEDRVGNIGLWAEFNILIDPEAAAEILHNKEAARKTTLVPLDLSHQVLCTKIIRERIMYGGAEQTGKGKTTLRAMLGELLKFVAGAYA
jgi:uridine nucleosidase